MTQGNYTHANNVAIKDIDYQQLAHLSEQHGIAFDELCRKAEKGLPIEGGRKLEDPNEWVGYDMAGLLLGARSLHSAFTSEHAELEYFGIEWKTRSLIKPKGKRGCGVLFKRADITVVNNIRIGARLGLMAALKVYQAMELGRI